MHRLAQIYARVGENARESDAGYSQPKMEVPSVNTQRFDSQSSIAE